MARALDTAVPVGICLLLAFGPLALGATEASAIFLLEEGAVLLLVLWAIRSLAAGPAEVTTSPLFIPMLAFAEIVGLQLLLHLSAYNYATYERALLWLAYGVLAFLAAQSFRSDLWRKRFGIAVSVFGCSLALFAIIQKFAGNGKIYWVLKNQAAADFFGPYANHAHYAGLMEMLLPFPLVLAMGRFTAVPARVWYGCSAVIMGSSIFLSRSRGGVIAMVIELGVLTLLASQGRPRRSQIRFWSGFGLLLLFCILLVRPNGLWDRFLQVRVPADKAHDENRLTMLEDSFSMVRARPLLGWGFGNFAVVYPSFRSFYTDFTVNAAHDDVMELTVETGLAGLAVVIAFLYLLYRRGVLNSKHWRHDPGANIALAALVGCTGLVVHSFFDFNLQVPANSALFFVLAVMATTMVSEPGSAASARRTLAVAGCIVLAAVYGWLAARSFQAARLGASLDIASLERSIALAPGDAAHQNLLCRFLLFDKQDPTTALPSCQRATELNPYHSGYWLDLALAYFSIGAEREQEQAILKAIAVDPKTPDVAWNAGNFFLAQGKIPEALHQFSVAMLGDPNQVQPAIELCWRRLHDARAIQSVLPPDPAAYLQFIRLLTGKGQWDAAHEAWSAMMKLNRPVDYRYALFYVDDLLQRREAARAEEAWEQVMEHSPALAGYTRDGGLIVDGGFEEPILNAGFDWRLAPQPGIDISVDNNQFHIGAQSLAIAYHGVGGDAGILQFVPVKPNTKYVLSAWVKSEQLDAANGPVISVTDDSDGTLLAHTPETLGSTPWHQVESAFETGPQTELVVVGITRDPGTTHIQGKLWVDGVTLRP